MHLLITGGAGYIGSVVAEFALAAGHTVTVIANLQEGNRAAVPAAAAFIPADVGDARALARALGGPQVDAVVHLAAETTVATSVTDPAKYFLSNVSKGLTLLEAMRHHNVRRIVFSSTA